MPLHVSSLSRRQFLLRGTAAATAITFCRDGFAAEDVDTNRFALLADTHIPASAQTEARGTNMTENLQRVIGQLCQLQRKPGGVIINGDCAYLKGLPGDYANLAACLQPLATADLPLHLTMGNHDDRGPFYDALAAARPETPPVESKHTSIVSSPHANFFLLDSLREVNVVTGEIGAAQRKWLAGALDAHRDKPAIIVAHHHLQFQAPAEGTPYGGLQDTEALWELLASREHVKAYVFGHTHNWSIDHRDGIHLINLPPVAYVFSDDKPNGWVDAQIHPDSMELELRTHDPQHPQANTRVQLAWR